MSTMIIHDDVRRIAAPFNLDPALPQAIINAEGGMDRILTAVRCGEPSCKDRDEAIRITCRSIVHRLHDFAKLYHARDFCAYMGSIWAPVGAANDPRGLNTNWPSNVFKFWVQH